MIILAIETSTMLGGLALMDSDEGLLAERRLNIRSTHSERLMPELKAMMELSGLSAKDLGAVAVSIGPGGFTGLRVGLSAAKGLCYGTGIKIVPVPTLEAMAHCLPYSKTPICPMMDARRGEVYTGLYSTESGEPKEIVAPRAIMAGEFIASLKGHEEIIVLGQGATVYREEVEKTFSGTVNYPPAHIMVPSPSAVASLGIRLLETGELWDPISLVPMYLRKSEAEIKAG